MTLPIADYDYELPQELIAQEPAEPRDSSRLMVVRRADGYIEHARFYEIGRFLRPGDLLVANESRVLPARLFGRKPTGGRVEALLLRQVDELRWEALVRGRGLAPGTQLVFTPAAGQAEPQVSATIEALLDHGGRLLCFEQPVEPFLDALGEMPLPPYIHQPVAPERYQTVYSRTPGSAAAPTAGLHFTPELIDTLRAQGIAWATVTLHVGLDTFRPVQEDDALRHQMHSEWFELPAATAEAINRTRRSGGRVVAVGTTSVRVLESAALHAGIQPEQRHGPPLLPVSGWTDIYIYPPYRFGVVDAMITNFHLPRSTLLLLVSAFAGRDLILRAYAEAIRERYRFFSLGDAMLLL